MAKQSQFHAHLTLLDFHDATIARDLCVLMLLHWLNNTTDTIEQAEIKATLMYTFCGVAMPDYCYDRWVKSYARHYMRSYATTQVAFCCSGHPQKTLYDSTHATTILPRRIRHDSRHPEKPRLLAVPEQVDASHAR